MQRDHFDETTATARLPNLDIEIVRSSSLAGDAERVTISLQAAPSFEAFGRFLEATNPFLFWMRLAQTVWTPWFGSAPSNLTLGNFGRLSAMADIAGPDATHHGDDV
ncbi:MAG: hypothetical protein ACRECZ_08285 [Methylocella sp.]